MVVSLDVLWIAQAGRCHYCKGQMTKRQGRGHSITRDHLIPKTRGGGNARDNLVGACRRCNDLKDDMSVTEFWCAYPNGNAIELVSPMLAFDLKVSASWQRQPRARPGPAVTTIRADHEAVWQELKSRFPAKE